MFRKIFFAVISSLVVLSLSAFPVYASTTVVKVSAGVEMVDSGIEVVSGETITLSTKGMAITGPLNLYPGAKSKAGGQVTICGVGPGYVEGEVCALFNAPFGALIGKIGAGGSWFLIGDSGSFITPSSGRLYLAVNDFIGTYGDNLGGFTVLFKGL
jgi:hypothetical protein